MYISYSHIMLKMHIRPIYENLNHREQFHGFIIYYTEAGEERMNQSQLDLVQYEQLLIRTTNKTNKKTKFSVFDSTFKYKTYFKPVLESDQNGCRLA